MRDNRKYGDRRQYPMRAVHARRKKIRRMAVEYKGGKCEICGYDRCVEALEFHHNDLSKKKFGISGKGYTKGWKIVKDELDKCILICANCHRELHAKLAAPAGNDGVKKRVNSGKPRQVFFANLIGGAILSQAINHSPLRVQVRGRCRD